VTGKEKRGGVRGFVMNIGLHAEVRKQPCEAEAYRVLSHRYWDAKEKFIASRAMLS